MTHPSTLLWSEVVRIASLLHWPLDSILDLEHPVRRRVLAEVEVGGRSLPGVEPW